MMGIADSCPPALRERAPCVLEDLSRVTRCRVRLGVLQDLEAAYIEKLPGPRPVSSFMPAATLPLHATALGRALLAFAPASIVEMTILRGLRAYTPHTVTAPDRFRRALGVVRTTRVAVTRFELEATTCGIAVPVFGPGGELVAAIELTVPDLGREVQPVIASLSIAARSLSRELSGGTAGSLATAEGV